MNANLTIAAFGIIWNNDNKVLLCHRRDYDLWNLPGGALEENEAPFDCVVREVKEEAGLNVAVVRLAGVYRKPEQNEIAFSFVCNIVGGEITATDEADKIAYFSADNLPPNTSPKQAERIKDAIANPNETVYKTQTGKSSIQLINEGRL